MSDVFDDGLDSELATLDIDSLVDGHDREKNSRTQVYCVVTSGLSCN